MTTNNKNHPQIISLAHLADLGSIVLRFVNCPDDYLTKTGVDTFDFCPMSPPSLDNSSAIWSFEGTATDLRGFNHNMKLMQDKKLVDDIWNGCRMQYKLSVYHNNFVGDGNNGILGKTPMFYIRYFNPWNLLSCDIAYPVTIVNIP